MKTKTVITTTIIDDSQSEGELKGVFGSFYREAKKMDVNTVEKLTETYNKKKDLLKSTENE